LPNFFADWRSSGRSIPATIQLLAKPAAASERHPFSEFPGNGHAPSFESKIVAKPKEIVVAVTLEILGESVRLAALP